MTRSLQVFLVLALAFLAVGCGETGGKRNSWKAVFLTSGQVYYGKLDRAQGQFYKLRDVYYIRVNQAQDTTKPPDLTLIKLGNEIHGPEDAIYLNRDHILYIEDLKEEGQVVKAIADAKAAGTTPAVAGQPPAPDAAVGVPAPGAVPPDQAEQYRQFQEFMKNQQKAAPAAAEKPQKK